MATSVLVNISEMIDLAIGTPEVGDSEKVGVVDFNMLHTVLHCLAQQLRIQAKNVELSGSVTTLPAVRENVQTITITEYPVDTDQEKKADIPLQPAQTDQSTMLVVHRFRGTGSTTGKTPQPTSPAPSAKPAVQAHRTPEHVRTSGECITLVSLSKFQLLESTVNDLKHTVYGTLPKNEDIIRDVRSQTNVNAIADMWTNLNVSSRLEAAEAGLGKLSSLVQDLINEMADVQDTMTTHGMPTTHGGRAGVAGAAGAAGAEGGVVGTGELGGASMPADAAGDINKLKTDIEQLKSETSWLIDNMKNMLNDLQDAQGGDAEGIEGKGEAQGAGGQGAAGAQGVEGEGADGGGAAGGAAGKHHGPRGKGLGPRGSFTAVTNPIWERISELEKKMQICCDEINKAEGVMKDNIDCFQDQIEGLTSQLSLLGSDLNGGKLSPGLVKDLQGLMQLFETVQEMQDQLNKVHETAMQLAAEKDERQSHTDALLEQIELLKTIKLDREDMVEAMADKADLRMLARKVSHDQFELACDDLSRGLEQAVGKLNMQEELWQQALDDIQREIETKLDKMELCPVKEFFNTKLKQLQDNLKQMASLRREVEAAGTKRQLLKDVNCISCDADVVMVMNPSMNMTLPGMPPPQHSMKPYLTYELDTIRKQQISNVPQRNMRDWEAIDKQAKQAVGAPGAPGTLGRQSGATGGPSSAGGPGGHGSAGAGGLRSGRRRSSQKHVCNRYCGGSHTTTTPAQRVARLGHFIKQWGPDVVPLSSGYAAGDDGRLYMVTVDERATDGPGGAAEAPCTERVRESLKSGDAKATSSARLAKGVDCRCLDDEPRL